MRSFPIQLGVLYTLFVTSSSQTVAHNGSGKRGITYQGTDNPDDYDIFTSSSSQLTWYYNWSPNLVQYPSGFDRLSFAPLIHGIDNLKSDVDQLRHLPKTSTHLLSFNEPDGSVESGGSDILPPAAAAAYISSISLLSVQNGGRWLVSWPATTGTYNGLNWLRSFNESCFAINKTHGCVHDFVALHAYSDFPFLASYLGLLNEYYNTNTSRNLKFWITEFALPQADPTTTLRMMNTTLPYLDQLPYVERYSWFGFVRTTVANEWTGDGVCLLDSNGDLTQLGAVYLGGEVDGYYTGQDASTNTATPTPSPGSALRLCLALLLVCLLSHCLR